jgi:hypothetical protein
MTPSTVQAAHAAFSDDKNSSALSAANLDLIHLETGEIESVSPAGVEEIQSICSAGKGEFYLTKWPPGREKLSCIAPAWVAVAEATSRLSSAPY